MEDVAAKGVTYTVVSAKLPGEFILRGIKKWTTPEALKSRMEPYVVVFEDKLELEWTYHNYFVPYYLEYGSGDIPDRRFVATDGIYIHRFTSDNSYGPAKLLKGL